MTPDRWLQVEDLCQKALDLPDDQRPEFLAEACHGDEALRHEVESLLSHSDESSDFIENPAVDMLARSLANNKGFEIIGSRLGPYQVLSHLGSGGMGEIYLAEDARLQRTVVLKLLPEVLRIDQIARSRFLREARLASSIDHSNVCTIYEINDDSGVDFIAMQYIEGKTLKEVVAGQPLDTGRLLSFAVQIASGLAAAHEKGIVHRDLKPTNIIITEKDQVKILDFGLAKHIAQNDAEASDTVEMTQTGAVLGTPAYMSPEQVRAVPVDHRSDLFSFGLILYEMTTGRAPFNHSGRSSVEVMNAVLHERPRPAIEINPSTPTGLQLVIQRALQKLPNARYQSADEMLIDINSVLAEISSKPLAGSQGRRSNAGVDDPYGDGGHSLTLQETQQLSETQSKNDDHVTQEINERSAIQVNNRKWMLALLSLALVGLLTVAGSYFFRQTQTSQIPLQQIHSIAVLPLKNLTGDEANDYLSDGITESLIDSLSRIGELKIIPRSAAFRYKGPPTDPVQIGKELTVGAVLDGNMRKDGDSIRISIRIVSSADGSVLWTSEPFQRTLKDIFDLQDDLARNVMKELRVSLRDGEKQKSSRSYTANSEAYQLYLKGRFYWNQLTQDSLKRSIDYYNLAVTKDPDFALAYAGIADSYVILAQDFMSPKEVLPKAKAAAAKALEINESLAAAHISMGSVKLFLEWDWKGARREADRAKELDPAYQEAIEINTNYGDGHHFYCGFLEAIGQADEAIREINKARAIDPLSTMLVYELGMSYYSDRNYDQALEVSEQLLKPDSDIYLAYVLRAAAFGQKEMYEQAINALTKARSLPTGDVPSVMAELGYAYASAGKRAEAEAVIADLKKRSTKEFIDPYGLAIIYLALGQKDEAIRWLEKAVEIRSTFVVSLNIEPKFDPIRSDLRFKDILKRVGPA